MKEKEQGAAARGRTEKNMRRTAALLSEMLAHTVAETRRLQRQKEKQMGRHYEDKQELAENYQPGEMKTLTALLKDITAVTKALDERTDETMQNSAMGVVLLPQVEENLREEEMEDESGH